MQSDQQFSRLVVDERSVYSSYLKMGRLSVFGVFDLSPQQVKLPASDPQTDAAGEEYPEGSRSHYPVHRHVCPFWPCHENPLWPFQALALAGMACLRIGASMFLRIRCWWRVLWFLVGEVVCTGLFASTVMYGEPLRLFRVIFGHADVLEPHATLTALSHNVPLCGDATVEC